MLHTTSSDSQTPLHEDIVLHCQVCAVAGISSYRSKLAHVSLDISARPPLTIALQPSHDYLLCDLPSRVKYELP